MLKVNGDEAITVGSDYQVTAIFTNTLCISSVDELSDQINHTALEISCLHANHQLQTVSGIQQVIMTQIQIKSQTESL